MLEYFELVERGDVISLIKDTMKQPFTQDELIKRLYKLNAEMSAREYLILANRFKHSDADLSTKCKWRTFEEEQPDAAVFLLKCWDAEHPEKKRKTYAEDFKEKHPRAEWIARINGLCPIVCRRTIYGKRGRDHCGKGFDKTDDCTACWQEEMEGGDD